MYKKMRNAIQQSIGQSYLSFLDALPDAVLLVDLNSTIVQTNAQAQRMFGYQGDELNNQTIDILIPEQHHSDHHKHVSAYMTKPKRRAMRTLSFLFAQRKDGSVFPVDIMLGPFQTDDVSLIICTVRDVTETRKTQEALTASLQRERHMARTDSLTGANNSRYFYDLLEQEMESSRRYQKLITLIYVDLDNFKQVNDQQGHNEGDHLLCEVVRCMKHYRRESDIIARVGGDEFAMLLPKTDKQGARVAITQIRTKLLEAMQQKGWPVTFSIGVLTCNEVPESSDKMVKMVDELMYSVKRHGKNDICYGTYP
ncbi:diguanylate cyclase [Neptunicella sp. SCSIO 80796]|uniref:sensor domain-containing diguanylate cyclase n=1 Tax=Neptunicella plasticusilytica TaxID=3117012 RepID=UPI003A4D7AC9